MSHWAPIKIVTNVAEQQTTKHSLKLHSEIIATLKSVVYCEVVSKKIKIWVHLSETFRVWQETFALHLIADKKLRNKAKWWELNASILLVAFKLVSLAVSSFALISFLFESIAVLIRLIKAKLIICRSWKQQSHNFLALGSSLALAFARN